MSEIINEPTPTPTPAPGNNEPEKTFTQDDVDRIVADRLKRDRKNYPDDEELKAFNAWKKSQKSEEEKREEERKRFAAAQTELNLLKSEKKAISEGVKPEFAEFVASKMNADGFDMKDFKEQNPQYFKEKEENFRKVSTAPKGGGSPKSETTNNKMNDLIRGAKYR